MGALAYVRTFQQLAGGAILEQKMQDGEAGFQGCVKFFQKVAASFSAVIKKLMGAQLSARRLH